MKEFNNINSIESLYRQNQLRAKESVDTRCLQSRHRVSTLSEPVVELIAYCLNSNHYHLLMKQIVDKGVSKFMHKLGMGYTKYFNDKNNRSGSLFQGAYKVVPAESTDQLIYLSCYINGNPEIHKIAKAEKYIWSSYQDYLGERNGIMCNKNIILENFKNIQEYKDLVDLVIKESSSRKDEMKKYILEN